MFWDANIKLSNSRNYTDEIKKASTMFSKCIKLFEAYLPVEHRGFIDNSGDLSCLVKIPYRIFVGGIAFNTTKEELKEFFSRYGAVRDTKIIRDSEGLSKGYGFVTFFREEDAQKVMNMGTIFFKEKRLNISEAYRKQSNLQTSTNQQAVISIPVAAPSPWATAASTTMTPVYYTTVNQGPQIPAMHLPSVVQTGVHQVARQPEMVYWVPQYYYY